MAKATFQLRLREWHLVWKKSVGPAHRAFVHILCIECLQTSKSRSDLLFDVLKVDVHDRLQNCFELTAYPFLFFINIIE